MSGLGLLGAYASGSDSDSDSDTADDREEPVIVDSKAGAPAPAALSNPFGSRSSGGSAAATLPKPSFLQKTEDFSAASQSTVKGSTNSVFYNPFRAREDEKRAILEQHVSVTARQEEMRTINGRKVCWNFRKGRCRFGHKCSFAHDSDIGLKTREPDAEKVITGGSVGDVKSGLADSQNTQGTPPVTVSRTVPKVAPTPPSTTEDESRVYDDSAVIEGEDTQLGSKKKKRPGLSEGVMPSKKAMKFHNKVYNGT